MTGTIIKGLGGLYSVSNGTVSVEVKAKGVFRKEKIVPIVGDKVVVENDMISEILPRKNCLIRPPVANIDKLFIVSSLKNPEPDYIYIDKMTVIAEKFGIIPILIFTKNDLESKGEAENIYSKTPYKTIFTVADENIGGESILSEIKGNISALAGFSGVGKSSLLNMIARITNTDIRSAVGDVSKRLQRGKHTTRHVEFFPIGGGFIADTPGFGNLELSYFGIKNRDELAFYFSEFANLSENCRYSDCNHIKTKECSVLKAVENGIISRSRYESYCRLYEDMGKYKFWEDK